MILRKLLFCLVRIQTLCQIYIKETCLGKLQLNWCLIYLDDIIVLSKTLKEHLIHLRVAFQKLKEMGLKLNPSKCKFFKKSLMYLDHKISVNGIEIHNCKMKVV